MTTLTTIVSLVGLATTLTAPQGTPKPKFKPMSATEVDRQLSAMAGRPKAVAFKNLTLLGVSRLENGASNMALRWPSSVDGYQGGVAEMVGTRGGSNSQNWPQSVIDLRIYTNYPNKTHALVIPVIRHALDSGDSEYEIRINSTTVRRKIAGGTGSIMVTWKPTAAGYEGLSVKLVSPGRFFFEKVEVKYISD